MRKRKQKKFLTERDLEHLNCYFAPGGPKRYHSLKAVSKISYALNSPSGSIIQSVLSFYLSQPIG